MKAVTKGMEAFMSQVRRLFSGAGCMIPFSGYG